jgi:hypothetical protein
MGARNDLECLNCGGDEFHNGTLGPVRFSLNRKADVECSVCLLCGHVFTYIDEANLERVRSWRAKEPANA